MRRTLAFTIIELVVVIAIIAVLTGLLLPFINKARESNARTKCQNNLKTIMLAAHAFESANGELPSGVLGPNRTIPNGDSGLFQQVGMLVPLMPHLGLESLFTRMYSNLPDGHQHYFKRIGYFIDDEPGRPFEPWWNMTNSLTGTANSLWTLAQTRIPLFLCPSDNAESRTANTWTSFYTLDTTIHATAVGPSGANLGRTNYLGNAGAIGRSESDKFYAQLVGPFHNRSKLTFAEWTSADGTAFTIGIGEYLCDGERGGNDWSASWMAGNMVTGWGVMLSDPPFSQNPNQPIWTRFSGRHKGFVQKAFGDGSVRGTRKGVGYTFFEPDWYQLMYLSGWRDGYPTDAALAG
jgi:type II secretory pathway pseudopilin PulG